MSDTPKRSDQRTTSSGSNATQPYMTDAVIAGGTKAAHDQIAIDRDQSDENGDPPFTGDQHRDDAKGEPRAPDSDLEYQQGGDTSDEIGDPIPSAASQTKHATDQSKPLDERLSGNQR